MEKHTTYFYHPVNVLFWTGLQIYDIEDKRLNMLYKLYTFLVMGVIGGGYLASEIAFTIDHMDDLEVLTFALGYVMAHTISVIKLLLLISKRKAVGKFISSLEQGEFLPNFERGGDEEKEIIDYAVWRSMMQGKVFIITVGILVASNFLQGLISTKQMWDEHRANMTITPQPFPYPSKLPFAFSSQPVVAYFLALVYQTCCIWVFARYLGHSDTIITGLMMHVTAQFKIVTNSLLNVLTKAERNTNIYLSKITKNKSLEVYGEQDIDSGLIKKLNANLLLCVNDCVRHHNAILDLLDNMENTFNDLVLVQLLGYLIAICVGMYQLAMVEIASATFMSTVSFTLAMTFQLLIYCWNGNELSLHSVKVADAAFDCAWVGSSKAVQLSLVLIIQRAHRICYLTAGKFVDLTLETFMTIIRGSLSYSLVLRTVNEEEL